MKTSENSEEYKAPFPSINTNFHLFRSLEPELEAAEAELPVLKRKKELLLEAVDKDIKDSHIRALSACACNIAARVGDVLKEIIYEFDRGTDFLTYKSIEGLSASMLPISTALTLAHRPCSDRRPPVIRKQTHDLMLIPMSFRYHLESSSKFPLDADITLKLARITEKMLLNFREDFDAFRQIAEKQFNDYKKRQEESKETEKETEKEFVKKVKQHLRKV